MVAFIWVILEKKTNRGVESIQSAVVLRNSMWDFKRLIKRRQVEIPRSRKICALHFGRRTSGVLHVFVIQFCGIFRGQALFCPEFLTVEQKT